MSQVIRIPNIDNYTQEIINGELILTPKLKQQNNITDCDLDTTDFSGSTIVECKVKKEEEIISIKKRYISILIDIWKTMTTQNILRTTTIKMRKANENCIKGYSWCQDIGMSIENKDTNEILKEIVNMVKVNNYSIDLTIKLETGKIVNLCVSS
jgi:hypothetical protein